MIFFVKMIDFVRLIQYNDDKYFKMEWLDSGAIPDDHVDNCVQMR